MKDLYDVRLPCRPLVANSWTQSLCSINPLLTMRFALSLKRSADSDKAQEWKSTQITSAGNFASSPLSPVHLSAALDGIEMGPVHSQKGQLQAP